MSTWSLSKILSNVGSTSVLIELEQIDNSNVNFWLYFLSYLVISLLDMQTRHYEILANKVTKFRQKANLQRAYR